LGNNHRLLFANINAIPHTEKPYSNQITIVQSSGTGKSRMVHEQASLVFTIPFNIRDKGDNQGLYFTFFDFLERFRCTNADLAFPIPDGAVRDYLVTTSVSDDQHILKTNYLKFLASVFTQVNAELEKCRTEWREKSIRTAEDLAKWWSGHLEGVRAELYKAAIVGANKPIQVRIREDDK
jgi:hypothetical protein